MHRNSGQLISMKSRSISGYEQCGIKVNNNCLWKGRETKKKKTILQKFISIIYLSCFCFRLWLTHRGNEWHTRAIKFNLFRSSCLISEKSQHLLFGECIHYLWFQPFLVTCFDSNARSNNEHERFLSIILLSIMKTAQYFIPFVGQFSSPVCALLCVAFSCDLWACQISDSMRQYSGYNWYLVQQQFHWMHCFSSVRRITVTYRI